MNDEVTIFRRLVGMALVKPPAANFWDSHLDAQTQMIVASTYFLLGEFSLAEGKAQNAVTVERFITHALRRLLGQLSRSTERRQIEYQDKIRGKILWPSTYKARLTKGYNPTRFVCHEAKSQYDIPENQLLKYMLEQIDDCLKQVPNFIRYGSCYFVRDEITRPTEPRLGRIESAMAIYRRHIRLRDVTLPKRISEFHLLRAEVSRQEEYAAVAQFYRHYHNSVLAISWPKVASLGRGVMPLPPPSQQDGFWLQLSAAILRAQHSGGTR